MGAGAEALSQQKKHAEEVRKLEEEKGILEKRVVEVTATATEIQDESSMQIANLQEDNHALHARMSEMKNELACVKGKLDAIVKQFMEQASFASEKIEEAEAAAKRAQEQRSSFSERSAQRGVQLRKSLTLAQSDTVAQAKLREARLVSLEAEARKLQTRWGEMVSISSNSSECEEDSTA